MTVKYHNCPSVQMSCFFFAMNHYYESPFVSLGLQIPNQLKVLVNFDTTVFIHFKSTVFFWKDSNNKEFISKNG